MAWKNWQKDGKMYLPCNLWKDIFWPKQVGRLKKTTCRGFIIATVLLVPQIKMPVSIVKIPELVKKLSRGSLETTIENTANNLLAA